MLGAALLGISSSGVLGSAAARPLAIGGVMQGSGLDSRMLAGSEMLAVWTLPRLGVSVRNDPLDLRLMVGPRELRYTPALGWRAVGVTISGRLPVPQLASGSLYVPVEVLKLLSVTISADTPGLLDIAAPTWVVTANLPPSTAPLPASAPAATSAGTPAVTSAPPVRPNNGVGAVIRPAAIQPVPIPTPSNQPTVTPLANLDTVRVSRTMYRTVEVQRVVLELSHTAPHMVKREQSGLSVTLTGVSAQASQQTLPSGDELTVEPQGVNTVVHLGTGGGRSEIFTLTEPYRVVIDTTTYTDSSVPPPIDPNAMPDGVTYRNKGVLHLLSFDPARFQPRVITAPLGRSSEVADLVRLAGGVAGVNGGYFDPASSLPVDLVAVGGLMTASSLERRATVGFTAQGETLFGYPRPRYFLSGAFGNVMVNSVRAEPDRKLLTAFVGDGHTQVGADILTTLYVTPGGVAVQSALTGEVVPPRGTLAFTFDPERFPQLPRNAGAPLNVTLNWQAHDAPWQTASDALSAGPLLVQGGKVVLDPAREGFNTSTNIWRPTRQVALGTLSGQPTIAFFEYGTPEAFAAALAGAGVRDAVRLDSGSSATAYVTGGYAGLGGYLNTVWSRPVPNAIVFVPKTTTAKK